MIKHAVIRDAAMLVDLPVRQRQSSGAHRMQPGESSPPWLQKMSSRGSECARCSTLGYHRPCHRERSRLRTLSAWRSGSLGIAAALCLSTRKAGLATGEARAVVEALGAFELPIRLPEDVSTEALMDTQGRTRNSKVERSGSSLRRGWEARSSRIRLR